MINTTISPLALTQSMNNTMMSHLGIEFTDIGEDFLSGKMPVDDRTRQPFGILHGGASAVLIESLGSVASTLCIDVSKQVPVGVEINANHLRSVMNGFVHGTAKALHLGRRTHVWDVTLTDDAGKRVCVGRLTVMIVDRNSNK